MRTKAIKTKVFLEGLEVEFNSVQINETRNEPPSATVSFPEIGRASCRERV